MRLFDDSEIPLGDGAIVLREFALPGELDLPGDLEMTSSIEGVARESPFRHMVTPGGFRMSVAMTNCGELGWVSDRTGYRYTTIDPQTARPWPAMPNPFLRLAQTAARRAGFPDFVPDACLVNRYEPGAKLTLHQDRNERDFGHPIVSVSLGIPAVFLFGGLHRTDRVRRIRLEHGDVVVWGGPSRLFYHGVMPLKESVHPRLGPYRINLTFRRAG